MNGQKRSERNRDRMKKNDWILAGTVLIAALFFLVGNCFTERRGKDAEKYLRISRRRSFSGSQSGGRCGDYNWRT